MALSHPPLLSHPFYGVHGSAFLDIPCLVWDSQLRIAQKEDSFPVGGRLSFFQPAWVQIIPDQFVLEVVSQGYSLPFVKSPALAIASVEAALQTRSTAGRSCVPPVQWSICRGAKGFLLPLFSGYYAHWWVPLHFQSQWTQHLSLCCQVPHGDPHFYSAGSSQRLVDGVTGSQGRLFAHTDTPQSLAIYLVCPQALGMGAYCLSKKLLPFGLTTAPELLLSSWLL